MMDTERYLKIRSELDEIKRMIRDVSYQMQELREATRGAPNENQELPVREFYEHPWYKYKRDELIASGNYQQPEGEETAAA
jgi:hypothetical protein